MNRNHAFRASTRKYLHIAGFFELLLIAFIFTGNANAGFPEALEGLQNQDSATVMAEVRAAVEERSDIGLVLFFDALMIDNITSRKTSLKDSYPSKADRSTMPSTFEAILTIAQQQQMGEWLHSAAMASTAEVRYRWLFQMPEYLYLAKIPKNRISTLEDLAEEGSLSAAHELVAYYSYSDKNHSLEKAEYWFKNAAQMGDVSYAFLLALRYLNYPVPGVSPSQEECQSPDNKDICFKKDEEKGFYWLEQAARNSAQMPLSMRQIAYYIGNVLRSSFDTRTQDIRQAYLWYLFGLNSPDFGTEHGAYIQGIDSSYFISALNEMHKTGQMKVAAPLLNSVWKDEKKRNEILYPERLQQLPAWIAEAKQQSTSRTPVFSYHRLEYMYYHMDVYSDGKVMLQISGSDSNAGLQNFYLQVSPQKVDQFIHQLKQLGFEDWLLINSSKLESSYRCDGHHPCRSNDNFITVYQGTEKKGVYLGYDKKLPEKYVDAHLKKRIAQLFALVEEYFPTQKFRCTLGNSEAYNHACIQHDLKMIELAKRGSD